MLFKSFSMSFGFSVLTFKQYSGFWSARGYQHGRYQTGQITVRTPLARLTLKQRQSLNELVTHDLTQRRKLVAFVKNWSLWIEWILSFPRIISLPAEYFPSAMQTIESQGDKQCLCQLGLKPIISFQVCKFDIFLISYR